MAKKHAVFEEQLQQSCVSIQRHFPDVVGIYLFGSAFQRGMRPDSDVDLALLGEQPYDSMELRKETLLLEAIFGRAVDLIDLIEADPVLRAEAMLKGRLVFCRDTNQCILAEIAAARCLEEHKMWIDPIIRDILTRDSTFSSSSHQHDQQDRAGS